MIEIDEDTLVTACEDHDVQLMTSYSGRFMFGRQCIGVIGGAADLMTFLNEVLTEIEGATNDNAKNTTWSLQDPEWRDARQDNMGSDLIFYWPEVRVVKASKQA